MHRSNYSTASELRKSLNLVILGVTFGMGFFTVIGNPIGAPAFTGFIRLLGAGDLVYGAIMALPVLGGIAQVFASYAIENTGKRRSYFLLFGFIHRLTWIPIALIPLLLPSLNNSVKICLVTTLIAIASTSSSIINVTFLSWMGDLVPIEIKGRFFGRRTAISTISGAITGLVMGKVLDMVNGFDGFSVVLIIASLMGAADILCFLWVKHPQMKLSNEKTPFLVLLKEPFKDKNYIKLIIFVSTWNFGVNIAAPFFNVYMIEYLNMKYFAIALFSQVMGNIITILCIGYWGRLVDKFGCKPVMIICCSISVILPLLWIFATPANYFIVLLINLITGVVTPGYNMTAMNLSIWLAPEKNRSIYIALYTLINAIFGIAFAYISGGLLMEFMRPVFDKLTIPFIIGQKLNAYHILFIISGFICLLTVLLLSKRIVEHNSKPVKVLLRNLRG